MGAGASVLKGNQRVLKVLYNSMTGMLILNGQAVAAYDTDDYDEEDYDTPYAETLDGGTDIVMADHYLNPDHPRYEEVYDRVFGSDAEATEPDAKRQKVGLDLKDLQRFGLKVGGE